MKFVIVLTSSLLLAYFLLSFLFMIKTLRIINLKTRTAMNAKILVPVICVEAILYLLLCNLHDCTFRHCINILLCV